MALLLAPTESLDPVVRLVGAAGVVGGAALASAGVMQRGAAAAGADSVYAQARPSPAARCRAVFACLRAHVCARGIHSAPLAPPQVRRPVEAGVLAAALGLAFASASPARLGFALALAAATHVKLDADDRALQARRRRGAASAGVAPPPQPLTRALAVPARRAQDADAAYAAHALRTPRLVPSLKGLWALAAALTPPAAALAAPAALPAPLAAAAEALEKAPDADAAKKAAAKEPKMKGGKEKAAKSDKEGKKDKKSKK